MANLQRHAVARRVLIGVVFALSLAAGGAVGFYQVFDHFAGYDDEGYVMVSVQSFLDGKPLYNQVYSQYGPFYYLYKAALHRLSGAAVSHDATGLMTLGAWLGATLFCSLFCWRAHRFAVSGDRGLSAHLPMLWMLTGEAGSPPGVVRAPAGRGGVFVFVCGFREPTALGFAGLGRRGGGTGANEDQLRAVLLSWHWPERRCRLRSHASCGPLDYAC